MRNNEDKDKSIDENIWYVESVKEFVNRRKKGQIPLAQVKTYGCQQNVSDGEKIKGQLARIGCDFTEKSEEADLIIFNTCAVREHAEAKVFGNVGALKLLKKNNPKLIIGLCGCMMEQEHIAQKIRESYVFVDLVFGTNSVGRLPELLYEVMAGGKRVFERGETNGNIISEGIPTIRQFVYKAYVPIMYGCNNFCTYCVVPYVRGRERSRKIGDIMSEVKNLIESGCREITLLGQNVNSYGKGQEKSENFSGLLREICKIEGDYRIRFMTSHPKDATQELIDTMAENDKICTHLHLPVQSGSDKILRLMNRGYDCKKYLEIIEYAKSKIPDLSLTSDIIVGFPGESYEDFLETIKLVKSVKFSSLFTFIYSKRVGTKAADMDDPVPYKEKSRWFSELLYVQRGISEEIGKTQIGKTVRMLADESDGTRITGRSHGYMMVELDGGTKDIGNYFTVKVAGSKHGSLIGNKIK